MRNEIQWTPWIQLDDIDFVDDLALLSHTHVQTWKKIATFAETSAQLGLKISRAKTKLLSANTTPDAKNA